MRDRDADAKGHARTGYVAPFRLAMYRNALYVVGSRRKAPNSDVRAAALSVFAIERFVEAEYLKRYAFEILEGSRVGDILAVSFGPHLSDATGPHEPNGDRTHAFVLVFAGPCSAVKAVLATKWGASTTNTWIDRGSNTRARFDAAACSLRIERTVD